MRAPTTRPRPPLALAPLVALALALGLVPARAQDGPPPVVRVHVPAEDVGAQFPPGTELRALPLGEFDALVAGAERRARERGRGGPRLVRARHQARFSPGLLVGRSELTVAADAADVLPIEPWSPAILQGPESGAVAASSPSGETLLRLEPDAEASARGQMTVVLEWELRARPDSRGRIFALALPGDETTTLELDLPPGWEPSGAAGRREGPSAGAAPGRETWQFYGRVGGADLRLVNLAEPRPAVDRPRIWAGGPSRIDLNAPAGAANWTADWSVQVDDPNVGSFAVEIDPGLELLGVEGPGVREFRVEEGAPSRAFVATSAGGAEPITVRFKGRVGAPGEGPWSIPALRPVAPLVWTGGTTTVVLDSGHVVRDCRERDGRRIPPPPGDPAPAGSTLLVFESTAPGSVAELTFRPPGAEPVYTLRGRLSIREAGARLECEASGVGLPGISPEHELVVPAGWSVDRVELAGVEEPISWSRSERPDGSTLVRALIPASDASPAGRTLIVGAVATADRAQVVELPRVRPTRGRIADEAWVGLASKALQLSPDSARGLAWIDPDPAATPGLLPPPSPATADLSPILAWRWTSDDGAAKVEVRRVEEVPAGWVHIRARIEGDGRKLALTGWASVAATGRSAIPTRLWIDRTAGELAGWTFTDAADGSRLAPTILADPDRRLLGFPDRGVALELAPGAAPDGRAAIRFEWTTPWTGRGTVPLPCLPGAESPRGVVVVETPDRVRARIASEGLDRIEPSLAAALAPAPGASTSGGGATSTPGWAARAMTYSSPGGRLELTTEVLAPAPTGGLIRDARLTTRAYPDGRSLDRLWLLAAADQADSLPFRLPPGGSLAGARVDGRPVEPTRDGDSLSIPLGTDSGDRVRSVELDYRVEPPGPSADGRVRPAAPDFGLPCLSFAWDLTLPAGLALDEAGPGFLVDSAPPRPAWPFGTLGIARWRWPGERAAARAPREDLLRRLDERAGSPPADDLTFAEVFMGWDAGPEPLVVDRPALAGEGIGPRTRLAPPAREASGAVAALRARGLSLVLVDDALVVTSRRAASVPSGPASWRSAVAEAVLWGADATDRFQSASRWRGEPATGGPSSAPADRREPPPGWTSWRLTAGSWPGEGGWVETADAGRRVFLGWAAAAVAAFAGLRRPTSPRRGLIAPLSLMIVAVVLHDWREIGPESLTAGVFVGAFATLLVRLGQLLRRTLFGPRSGPTDPSRSARLRRGFRLASWGLAAAWLTPSWGFQPPPEAPILALLPYEGAFDPASEPSRVVIRQSDFERLGRWAQAPGPAGSRRVTIAAASHRVERGQGRDMVVESEYEVRVEDGPAAAFEFPVGGARDIAAYLGERRAPVSVRPGGESAIVAIPPGPDNRLRIRRVAAAARDGDLETLDLKVNRAPSARLTLEQPPESRPVQRLSARGRMVARGDRSIEALLGPVDRIGISWASPDPPDDQASASVESLMLWDLDPAGERVRARLTYRTRRRTSTIRIGLEPGLLPRSVQIPGLVDASWGGTEQKPEWVARVDPPLPDRTTIFLDFWRPRRDGATTAGDGPVARRFPRIEPLDVDRESSLLAVRRPGHWTGRLEPPPDGEPVGDEAFVRAWGTLPDDALTFAGTVRYRPQDGVEFRTGPSPTRWRLRPSVQLRIDAGRVDCRFEAELSDIAGLLDHVDLDLPAGLILLDVESAEMTDWSRPPGGPLRVRFDRVDLKSRRTIVARGWIPIDQAPAAPGPRQHRLRLPWIAAAGGEGPPGTLEVVSRGGVDLATDPGGASLLTSEPTEPGGAWTRLSYRIDDPSRVGELRWPPPPPRTNVAIASQLTIHPDSAEWVAVLRYESAGGPLDAIHLRVPTTWASQSRIRLDGRDHQLTSESRSESGEASTFWTIIPDRPVWGGQRLVVRSRSPIVSGQELRFPEITPLGKGFVDASLALVFATARMPTIAGSAGLRQIPYAGRFRDEEFGSTAGLAARAYHVDRPGWTLSVQAPPGDESGAGDGSARVRDADVACVIEPGGSTLGTALYRTEPRTGQYLTVAPPDGARLLRAAVDGEAVPSLLDAESRWTIPLGDQETKLVGLTWAVEEEVAATAGPRHVGLPRVGDGKTPTLVGVYMPPGTSLRPSSAPLESVGPERQHLERAARAARLAYDLVAEMDRGSARDRGRLVSLLIEHESALRGGERALSAAARSADRSRRDRAARDLESIQASRAQLVESLRASGLEEPVADAWAYLGLQPPDGVRAGAGVPEQADRERVRRLGRPAYFAGNAPGLDDPPIRLEIAPDRADDYAAVSEGRARSLLLLALLMGLGLAGLTSARQAGAQSLIAAATLSLAAVAGGPLALSIGGAALAAGWLARGPSPHEAASGP